jgi:hypothetical protein
MLPDSPGLNNKIQGVQYWDHEQGSALIRFAKLLVHLTVCSV